MRNCIHCGSPDVRLMAQMTVTFPAHMEHNLTAKNRRSKEFRVTGVQWETVDVICSKCSHVTDGYGNYVTRLRKAAEHARDMLANREGYMSARSQETLEMLTKALERK